MTVRKRALIFAALVVAVAVLAVPGVAMAFDTVHGGYTMDTDACAGCHRAHTASSPITWINTDGEERSALLLGGIAESVDEFCYTCHGSVALGADTNVWDGIFESRDGDLGTDEYYNADGAALNGGGFNPLMFPTQHYPGGATWVAWGAGFDGRDGIISMGGEKVEISCTVCHDTHGSSNWRLLKDIVAGIDPTTSARSDRVVGGYDAAGDPDPWVISAERGYPIGGWPKGEERMALYETYYPDFTSSRNAKAPGDDVTKGISGWCAACHTQMNTEGHSGTYLSFVYDANDGFGLVERHRHPTNVAISEFLGASPIMLDHELPLAHTPVVVDGLATGEIANDTEDWVDCLSCHVAHGSGAVMEGFASVADSTNPQPDTGTKVVQIDDETIVTVGSVPPDYGNALLRLDNRGICQACHYK